MEPSDRQTVAGAYAKIDTHEQVCAERYTNIHGSIGDIKALMKWSFGAMIAMAASLFGFMAHEIYDNNQARLERLESPPAAVSVRS